MISSLGQCRSLIVQADEAMARGDVRKAASLLEVAAQRGRDVSTLLRLATVRRSLGDYPGALRAAEAGVELSPRNFVMCLLLGSLREAMGAIHAAERAYRAACAYAPLNMDFQPAMGAQLRSATGLVAAMKGWRDRLLDWQPQDGSYDLAADEEARMRGFRTNILENLDAGPLAPPVFLIPKIKPKRYFSPVQFDGVRELERGVDSIRSEFLALAETKADLFSSRLGGLHGSEARSGGHGNWSMIPLMRNGRVVDEFASRCPRTMALAGGLDLPQLGLISPSLYFSVLEPNGRIAPHTGITNARVIAHLPLIVPQNCGFRVGGETRQWEEGRALVFDDMTEHEAWNESDRIRVVLIADLWRPELGAGERAVVRDLMTIAGVTP
jgi:hypothetical protein